MEATPFELLEAIVSRHTLAGRVCQVDDLDTGVKPGSRTVSAATQNLSAYSSNPSMRIVHMQIIEIIARKNR